MRTSFKSTNTIYDLTKPETKSNTHEHKQCGIYKLTWNTRKLLYVGRTSRNLKQRYQEHTPYIKQNYPQSAYALHTLNNKTTTVNMDPLIPPCPSKIQSITPHC